MNGSKTNKYAGCFPCFLKIYLIIFEAQTDFW